MRGSRSAANPLLVGALTVLTTVVAMGLSYNAHRGLPFVPVYEVSVQVPDAAELVRGAEVRTGGARVGIVDRIEAVAGPGGRPVARLDLRLDKRWEPLPADSVVRVRPRSVLGAKYLELRRGSSRRSVSAGGTLPLQQAEDVVSLDEALGAFDRGTREALAATVSELGTGTAGRGAPLNDAIAAAPALTARIRRVTADLASPRTRLSEFFAGAERTARAVAPVAGRLGGIFDAGATTFAAIDAAGPQLERAIAVLPVLEEAALRALPRVTPVLDDAAALATELRPAAAVLPAASRRLAAAARAATPALRAVPRLARDLGGTLAALGRLARNPAAIGSVEKLHATVASLEPTLRFLVPAQTVCNVFGLWTRNVNSTVSEGDGNGPWIRILALFGTRQAMQSAAQDVDLHVNPYPIEGADGECEAGNEPYSPGRVIGNPPGRQTGAETTSPPPGVPRP